MASYDSPSNLLVAGKEPQQAHADLRALSATLPWSVGPMTGCTSRSRTPDPELRELRHQTFPGSPGNGSPVNVTFLMRTGNNTHSSFPYKIKRGQKQASSFGGQPVPSQFSAVGGLAEQDRGQFWAPAINPC
ncbi:hypothetical protein ACFYVL_43150 [Streptomyces sp. NPDC004111]|uniref:hypothetical protein n=1 Tax=Streptomyces sp. NPDC004111 TaxID=3364690 RepID=UPI00367FBF50